MKEQTYEGKTFLEYANEAAGKIREINQVIEDVDYGIYIMIQMYLAPIVGKEIGSDELNDMATDIMSAEKEEISSIIEKYCKVSA